MKVTVNNQKHGFHLVDPSPWPLITAFSALMLTFGGILYMHGYVGGSSLLQLGVCMVLFMMFVWWRDVIREGNFKGQHTFIVQEAFSRGVSNPYLILCNMYMLARVQIGFYFLFYLTVLLQLLSAYNLSLVLFVLWCAFLLAYTLELNIGYCDKAFLNVVRDATLSAFIFLGSAFWYIQACKAKIKSLTQQIYSLLIKLQASLEAEIALMSANELAYNNSIAIKTAITVLLLTAIGLFAYWWFFGGPDGGPKDKSNSTDSISPQGSGGGNKSLASNSTDSISSKVSSGDSNDSLNQLLDLQPPADTTALNYSGLDKAVFDVIKSSVVGTTILPNKNSHLPEAKKRLEDLFDSVENLSSLLSDNSIWDSMEPAYVDVKAVNDLTDALSELQASFENRTAISDDLESSNRAQLAKLATNLAELLPEDLSNILSGQECPLLCSAVLLYIFTYGTKLLSILEDMVNLLLERANTYLENCPTEKFDALYKALYECKKVYDPLQKMFDSWAEKRVGDSPVYNFIRRFQDLFKNPA